MTGNRRAATDVMIDELLQNDHRLEISPHDADHYERLAQAATRFKKAPEGMRVRVEQNWREYKAWVILEALPSWMTVSLTPIDVPAVLRQPSDVVVQLRTREDLTIQPGERNRGLRLIEALVRESRSRGYIVAATKAPRKNQWGSYDRHQDDAGHVLIAIGPDRFRLSFSQESEKTPHVPTKAEQARAERGYGPPPKFDVTPTPNLRITIEGNEATFWRSFWSDKPAASLETSLAQILQELELRHDRAENNRREAERQQEERKRQWAAARVAAVEQLIQSQRATVLQEQVQQWELANRIRAYVAAIEARLGHLSLGEREDAEEWIRWARDYAERIDPCYSNLSMPDDPKPTPEALKPFMKGLSPYGPS